MAMDEEQQITNMEAAIRALPEGRIRRGVEVSLQRVAGEYRTDGRMKIILSVPGSPKMAICLPQNATVKDLRDTAAEKVGVEPDPFRFPGLPHRDAVPLVDLGMENGSMVDIIVHPALLHFEKAQLKRPNESSFEKLVLALHYCCIEAGFVCSKKKEVDTSQQTHLPGFAPAVRETDVSNDGSPPVGWNSTPGAVCFEYRHPNLPGITYEFKAVLIDGEITSTFVSNVGTGASASTSIQSCSVKEDGLKSLDAFQEALQQFETSVLAYFFPERRRSTSPSNLCTTPASSYISFPSTARFDTRGMQPPGGGTGDFSGDLEPDVGIGPVIGPGSGTGYRGNLMGPAHPVFGEDSQGNLPQPRFDPYGPPMPGMPVRPQGPGRPRPPNRQPYGDPDPDHLPAPGGNDNMFL